MPSETSSFSDNEFDIDLLELSFNLIELSEFESISYFNTIVAKTTDVKTLFTKTEDGFVANYVESEAVIKDMFPTDATLFVMCQVGGRVQPFLQLLDQLGYDMSKVYNIGGWNQLANYKGEVGKYYGYNVSLGIGASSIAYDFSGLTPVAA